MKYIDKISNGLKKYNLEIVVFVCGIITMTIELVGSRILAPYLGTTIYVWTSIIGVILGSLSLGYYLGGRLSLEQSDKGKLSLIIFMTAIFTVLTALFFNPFLKWISSLIIDIKLNAIIVSIVLFTPCNIFLGMITPYAIQLRLEDVKKTGMVVGNLYAISTAGNILGTFLTGFYFISFFGSATILFIIPIVLALLSFYICMDKHNSIRLIVFLMTIFILRFITLNASNGNPQTLHIDTRYAHIQIKDSKLKIHGEYKAIRSIIAGNNIYYSSIVLGDNTKSPLNSIKYYRLADHFNSDRKNVLIIGGAGYSLPNELLNKNQDLKIDVIEIDPEITEIARKYFDLKDNPRLTIYHEDGRTFINQNTNRKYDAIYIDAFNDGTPPFQLTTKETITKLFQMLNEKGVILMNLISAIDGEKGKFFRSEYETYRTIFPQVFAFQTKKVGGKNVQNIMLIAVKSNKQRQLSNENMELQTYLSNLWRGNIVEDFIILTDDYAPVENLTEFYDKL